MGLLEAIKELRDELETGSRPDEALEYVCEEHGLNPELVIRKFAEQYRSSHREWKPPVLAEAPKVTPVDWEELSPAEAVHEWSKHFNYALGESVKIGKRFDFFGEAYLFVHFRSNFDMGYIKAVELSTGKRKRLSWRMKTKLDPILSQIF